MNLNLETGFDKPDWICAQLQCSSPKNIFASIPNKRLCSNERARMRRDAQKFHTVSHAMCPLDPHTITKVEKVYGNSIASCLKYNYKYM